MTDRLGYSLITTKNVKRIRDARARGWEGKRPRVAVGGRKRIRGREREKYA